MSARSFIRTSSLVLAALALLVSAPAAAKRKDVHGLPLPRGSRSLENNLFESSRGFRKTVDYYKRLLKRRGLLHEAVPVYGYRGTVVARFIAREKGSRWKALHVYKSRGRTRIFIVPATVLTEGARRGKEPSPER